MFKKFFTLTVVLVIAGCASAPVYETKSTYTDPETHQGKTSAIQCQMAQSQCEQIVELKQDSCVQKKDKELDACQSKGGASAFCLDHRGECKADKSSCEKQYNRCFQVAGGKVKTETVCVENCENIKH